MPEVKSHAPGEYCWIELNTSDVAAAKRFYFDLFDWQAEDEGAGTDMAYTHLQIGGLNIGAMCALQPESLAQGVPPHWMSYMAVENADEAAAKAAALGGTVVMGAFDVMDAGRMAILQDPQGATFCVWQAKASIGIALVGNEIGTFGWNELWTTDCAAATTFYTGLFGWSAKADAAPGGYTEWQLNDQSIGGMMKIQADMGPVPPNWLPYFLVADCNATAAKAIAGGGKLFVEPMDIPDVGRFSVIADPQGATFAVIMLLEPMH
jgi:hypothetical protein